MIAPTAPKRHVKCIDNAKLHSWYNIGNLGGPYLLDQKNYNFVEMKESVNFLTDLIYQEIATLGDAKRVYIGGF